MKKEKKNKNMMLFIELSYNEIYKKMNTNLTIDTKRKVKELTENGIITSGISQSILLEFLNQFMVETINHVEQLFINAQNEFNDIILESDLKEYIFKSKTNVDNYALEFKKILLKYLEKYLLDGKLSETTESMLHNMISNNKNRIDTIYLKLTLKNNGRRTEDSIKISKIANTIAIISLLTSILSTVLSIIVSIY